MRPLTPYDLRELRALIERHTLALRIQLVGPRAAEPEREED